MIYLFLNTAVVKILLSVIIKYIGGKIRPLVKSDTVFEARHFYEDVDTSAWVCTVPTEQIFALILAEVVLKVPFVMKVRVIRIF